ncbi:MAG TPA: AtpZ/AtpI family protein, partial [Candidatus Nitrosotenuis sp.]|nr:AtpZ/AtpI family protein [Candidatus Nitrosotenuis sp.]
IDELKHPGSKGDGATARGLGLAVSLGAVFLGSIIGTYYLGQMLDHKLNSTLYTPLAMMAGVLVGFVAAWRLLQPFLGDKK